jgi:glycosyltransferase involved in cell wall biosynthesis
MPSFYQDDLFRALATKVDLRVVYDHELTADRRQLGWKQGCSDYDFSVLRSNRKTYNAMCIAHSERDRMHIIGGLWAEPAFVAAVLTLGMAHAPFAIYAEAPNSGVSRSAARQALRSSIGRWIVRRAVGFLAVSHFADDYYGGVGCTPGQLYPFGYFRESPPPPRLAHETNGVDIVFVGQLIHRKGIDILLQAAGPVLAENPSVRVSLIGSGPDQELIAANLRSAGIADRVILEGPLPSARIHERLVRADLLILPSRWDGWGLVINEAFAAGIPVIASDQCGGADLICHGVNGYVFRSEDVGDLRACLGAFRSADRKQMRAAAVQTSSALSIPVVVDYLVACLEHMTGIRSERPIAPWQQVVAELRRLNDVPMSVPN